MSRRAAAKNDDGKKKKQQAASLARRMAGKKGQTTQLQTEVNNDEDWEKLLTKEGLIVIDVFSEWSGPCVGMIGNLKKAKVDFGGDSLHLAIAKNDEIECLARFRNRSEPTWLLSAGGLLVNLMFGANAPKLMKMIEYEVKHEMRVLKGETWRHGGPFTELMEEEKERLEVSERLKAEAERNEADKLTREIEERRMKVYNHMADHLCYESVIICFPHTIYPELGCVVTPDLELFLRTHMMYVNNQTKVVITRKMFDEIFFRGSLEPTEELMEDLALGPCLVLLLKSQIIVNPGQEGEKKPGDLEKILCEALNDVELEPGQEYVVPSPHSIPSKYPYIRKLKVEVEDEEGEGGEGEEVEENEEETAVPGCWTPATYVTKCAAIRYLFPVRAEKVMPHEEEVVKSKVVIAFSIAKQKECFDLIEEHREDVLNFGYFSGTDPKTAEHLCATPEQYAKLPHYETNKLVVVLKKVKSEPLLSFAGLGAAYVSLDDRAGLAEADMFFPPGVEPRFPRLEEAERLAQAALEEAPEEEEEQVAEEEVEDEVQDEDDLMALLGVTI